MEESFLKNKSYGELQIKCKELLAMLVATVKTAKSNFSFFTFSLFSFLPSLFTFHFSLFVSLHYCHLPKTIPCLLICYLINIYTG